VCVCVNFMRQTAFAGVCFFFYSFIYLFDWFICIMLINRGVTLKKKAKQQ
jgi:hypothetical protein